MDQFFLLATFAVGLIVEPFIVAKVWPERSCCVGNVTSGECGVTPMFWGLALGCGTGYLAIAVLIATSGDDLASPATKAQLIALLFVFLAALMAPLVVCGFHSWTWDADRLHFIGALRRKTIRWKDIASVRRARRTAWTLIAADGTKLSISNYMRGERFIIAALCVNRPDFAPQVKGALEAERA